jgi:hypothetical protein
MLGGSTLPYSALARSGQAMVAAFQVLTETFAYSTVGASAGTKLTLDLANSYGQ